MRDIPSQLCFNQMNENRKFGTDCGICLFCACVAFNSFFIVYLARGTIEGEMYTKFDKDISIIEEVSSE